MWVKQNAMIKTKEIASRRRWLLARPASAVVLFYTLQKKLPSFWCEMELLLIY
jgi:hypothetical protein